MEWHKSSAGLECRVCNHQLTDKIAYETHLNLHGTVPKYQCVICGKANENRSRLKYHARIHVSANVFNVWNDFISSRDSRAVNETISYFSVFFPTRVRRKSYAITVDGNSFTKQL